MKKAARGFVIGAIIAGAAGYLAGLLTAPKSGKATRKDIEKAAGKAKTRAEAKLKTAYSQLDSLLKKAEQRLKTAKGEAKKSLTQALKQAERAKQKARQVLSAFHEGEVGEDNLKAAALDAKKAASHLEKYMGHKARAVKKALKKPQ